MIHRTQYEPRPELHISPVAAGAVLGASILAWAGIIILAWSVL